MDVPGTCQYRHPKNHDARLTPFGEQQCEALAAKSARVVAAAQLVGVNFYAQASSCQWPWSPPPPQTIVHTFTVPASPSIILMNRSRLMVHSYDN